jgi:hypothetical protein
MIILRDYRSPARSFEGPSKTVRTTEEYSSGKIGAAAFV